MGEATHFANRDGLAEFRPLNWPAAGGVLVEREMGAGSVIVHEVRGHDAAQVPLAEDEHMFQTLAPDRTDEALGERILPRAVRAVRTSSIPMPFIRRRNCWPK